MPRQIALALGRCLPVLAARPGRRRLKLVFSIYHLQRILDDQSWMLFGLQAYQLRALRNVSTPRTPWNLSTLPLVVTLTSQFGCGVNLKSGDRDRSQKS